MIVRIYRAPPADNGIGPQRSECTRPRSTFSRFFAFFGKGCRCDLPKTHPWQRERGVGSIFGSPSTCWCSVDNVWLEGCPRRWCHSVDGVLAVLVWREEDEWEAWGAFPAKNAFFTSFSSLLTSSTSSSSLLSSTLEGFPTILSLLSS